MGKEWNMQGMINQGLEWEVANDCKMDLANWGALGKAEIVCNNVHVPAHLINWYLVSGKS